MPAPPLESEPAMVSATGVVMMSDSAAAQLQQAGLPGRLKSGPLRTTRKGPSRVGERAIMGPTLPQGDARDGSLLRPDQVQARPVLHGGQRACRGRDRLRDLFHRGQL